MAPSLHYNGKMRESTTEDIENILDLLNPATLHTVIIYHKPTFYSFRSINLLLLHKML